MSKRFITLILTCALLLSACMAGAEQINMDSQWPVVNTQGVSLEIAVSCMGSDGPVEDMWLFKWLSAVSGIEINATGITKEAWEARKNLIMASGDLADIYWGFNWTTTDLYNYGVEGDFIALNDLIETYGTRIKAIDEYIGHNKMLGAATAPDGNIYGVPVMTEPAPDMLNRTTYGMGINTEMLKTVGKEIPTTMEELYEALVAMKNAGLNGAISAAYDAEFRSLTLAAYQIITVGEINDNIALKQTAQGEWTPVYIPLDERYKDWLTMLNKFYTEGLLDSTFFTTDTTTRAAKNQADPAAVIEKDYSSSIGNFPEIYQQYQVFLLNEYPELAPITYNTNHCAQGGFVITSACEHPEISMALIDRLYDPATMLVINQGPYIHDEVQYTELAKEVGIGYDFSRNEDGSFAAYTQPEIEKLNSGMTVYDYLHTVGAPSQVYDNLYPISGLYARVLLYNANPRNVGSAATSGSAFFRLQQQENIPNIAYRFPNVYLTLDEYERALELKGEIEDYVYSMEGRFISGELSIEENYDAFAAQLKKLGADEYLKIYADAYALLAK